MLGITISKSHNRFRLWPVLMMTGLMGLGWLSADSALASQTVLQDIKISAKDNDTVIDIGLGLPLQYVKHFPQSFGEIIQVQLLIDPESGRSIHKEVRQGEELNPPEGMEPLLIYVTYEEGVPGGPYLTLRFVKPVRFRLDAQKSLTSMSITVFGEEEVVEKPPVTPDLEPLDEEPTAPKAKAKTPTKKEADLGQLMAKARQALTFGDNDGAIRLLRKIISVSGNPHEQDARELLGLALERSGQIPRAKFEYKKYLELYKEGEGPKRVQQRLTALQNIGLGVERRQKLRVAKRGKKADEFRTFGRISQDYSTRLVQDEFEDEDEEDQSTLDKWVTSQRISTHASVRGRYRSDESIVQMVFVGSHNLGLTSNDRTESRVSDLYVDYEELKLGTTRMGFQGVFGRQRARNSGIFERFDGMDLGLRFFDGFTLHALGGQVVSFHDVSYDKQFGAVRAELGKRKAALTGNAYFVAQTVDEMDDRQAVGGDFRYNSKIHTFFGGLDYDVLFNQPTIGNLRWGWQWSPKSRFNLSYDYRKFLMTSTTVNQYTYRRTDNNDGTFEDIRLETVEEMLKVMTEEHIRELADLRQPASQTFTAGTTYQINKNKQMNIDISMFKTEAYQSIIFDEIDPQINENVNEVYGDSANNIDALMNDQINNSEATTSTMFTGQFIASNWYATGDLHVLGLRLSTFNSYNDVVFFWNGRLPPLGQWNLRPRANLGMREFTDDDPNALKGQRYQISPSIKVDRRWGKAWVFEAEFGFDIFQYSDNSDLDQSQQLVRIGYHYSF
ncbi:tetratricopeptide repeat protein [Kaarinaea lacus]